MPGWATIGDSGSLEGTGSGGMEVLRMALLCGSGLILISIWPGWMEQTESILVSLCLQVLLYHAWAADWAVSALAAAALLISFLAVQRTEPGYWLSALLFSGFAGCAAAFAVSSRLSMPAWAVGLAAGIAFFLLHFVNHHRRHHRDRSAAALTEPADAEETEPAAEQKEEPSANGN